ncbi:magnesium transporter [Caballeronia novacaledonica]|uniref:Magnesium transport protein CorA n=1 Tax=Caballeronia novacaledonica TaxID=1544861 RepID=A0A2U3I0Y6_9BURK|nr:magnesium/cobalt transporter CorA [Caballeronia novacaledonica]SPB13757.1 magnesium transporter [Caballeronia novacaledonica]
MLVNCVAYQAGTKLADIRIDEIGCYVQKPECFVWVALKDPDPAELDTMKQQFGLDDLAIEDVRNGHQWPKIEEYEDSLLAVLHTVELDKDGELHIGEVDVFAGSNYVLSVRTRSQLGLQSVRARCEREPKRLKKGSGFILYALIDHVVDGYFPIIATLSTELEKIEARIFEGHSLGASRLIIEDLYSLKQRFVLMEHHVVPLLEGIGKLTGGRVPRVCKGLASYFKDVYLHLARIVKAIEGRGEMIVTAIEVNLGMIALAENEVTKRLGAFAALFAVPTMIAGVYGMNFENLPELHYKYGYPVCLMLMLIIDVILYWRFRKSGWL